MGSRRRHTPSRVQLGLSHTMVGRQPCFLYSSRLGRLGRAWPDDTGVGTHLVAFSLVRATNRWVVSPKSRTRTGWAGSGPTGPAKAGPARK